MRPEGSHLAYDLGSMGSRADPRRSSTAGALLEREAPVVSIVIPARDSEATLPHTLASVARLVTRHPHELILVDDGSRDRTAELARRAGARVIPCEGRGVADARNTGARHAEGEVILFIDSDVLLPPGALDLVVARILTEGWDAVTGRLSAAHPNPEFASQYKNLWMSYTYESLPERVSLFYTSAAAIRRRVFAESGGFGLGWVQPSVEDTAFGQLLGDRGYRVRADRDLAVEHLKSYRLRDVLALDYRRSRDLTRVFARRVGKLVSRGNSSSVPTTFMVSVPLPAGSLALGVAAAATSSPVALAGAIAILVLFWGLNGTFLTYLLKKRGLGFMLASHLFLAVDALAVAAGIAAGLVRSLGGRAL